MRDMLPRKPTTAVPDMKKGLKDSLYGNGMNVPSPALISPAASGGSSSPAQDTNEVLNMKTRLDSPKIFTRSSEEKLNSSSNCITSMLPKPLTSSIATATTASPHSSPGVATITRMKSSPKHKLRRNQSMEAKNRNEMFDFDGQVASENFCVNNNNNSKQIEKLAHQRRVCVKADEQTRTSRTPSTNSISDELSTSSLTPTTDEQTNIPGQNLGLNAIFDGVDDEMFDKVLKNIDKVPDDSSRAISNLVESFPDPDDDLPELSSEYASAFSTSTDHLLFESNQLTSTPTDLPTLEGEILSNMRDSPTSPPSKQPQISSTVTTATSSALIQASSASSPTFHTDPGSTKFSPTESSRKTGKSHLQDILGVTDTIRLKNMSRPIDSVPYKSPTTTTSYSTGVKLHSVTPNRPCTMAPPSRLTSNLPFNKPQFNFNEGHMFHPNSQNFIDTGVSGPWNRGSPRHIPPKLLKSPPFSGSYVETSVASTSVNPMSCLQSTVDSIPAAPVGSSKPGTPVMGPPACSPLGTDSSPGGRMRPPPSPSVPNDKRCVSADSVSAANNGKKGGNKRERTRSADSKDEEKKETTAPKTKRRKSRSKDDNAPGKKAAENKTPSRSNKEEKMPRHDSALSGLLDAQFQTNNPYVYIFNTDVANEAANTVNSNKVPDIILFHQSFLGNCKLRPSKHWKPNAMTTSIRTPTSDTMTPSMSMPTTSRSPTEITAEKIEPPPLISPKIEVPQIQLDHVHAINLQDTKPLMLPPLSSNGNGEKIPNAEVIFSQSTPTVTSHNGEQEELSAEKRRHREDKLGKLRKMEQLFLQESPGMGNHVHGGPAWPSQPGPMQYGPMGPQLDKGMRPVMKDIQMPPEGMIPTGHPMSQENVEWFHLIQEHNAEKRRHHEGGIPGDLPSRPPPPYGVNGPQHRWIGPEGYGMDPRMQDSRLQRMPHRPLGRIPQDPRVPAGYMPHRGVISRGPYPPPPNPRMPMYDPYMGQPVMRHTRRPPPPMRQQAASENYPFSEQLMKQASFYNSNMPVYDPNMGGEWGGAEGTQRLSHMPGTTSPVMVSQGMINPVEMNSRMTPGMPNRGYDPIGPYPPDMGQRFEMLPCSIGSPTGPMDVRMRGPSGVGSMMDAIARRGGQRPPDLNLNSQMTPRSPMNYHGQGPMPSPSMNPAVGPRYCNPGDMGHPPHPSPMPGCVRSPAMGQPLSMGPASAGVEPPQVMLGAGPHSAGPLSNPPPNDWPGPNSIIPGTPTPNSAMMHHMMTSQPSQAAMMTQQPHPGMMTSPVRMSQPGMMPSQPPQQQTMMALRMPNPPHSAKHGPSTLSIMMNRMNTFKMPEKSPLYQDAVKDTASPPPLTHSSEPPPLTHNTMPGGMRMPGPNHPPTYDARMGPPRMGGPQMNENFQQGYPGGHPSPMSVGPGNMLMPMGPESMPPPSDYQHRPNFSEMPEFDLRNILPSERPSQTISYLPPETNDQFSSWAPDGIRPQLMPGPNHPNGPNRPLI